MKQIHKIKKKKYYLRHKENMIQMQMIRMLKSIQKKEEQILNNFQKNYNL